MPEDTFQILSKRNVQHMFNLCLTSGNPSLEYFDTQSNTQILNKFKGFRVGHLNITSLIKHIEQLKIYLKNEPLDVVSINKTRLDVFVDVDRCR